MNAAQSRPCLCVRQTATAEPPTTSQLAMGTCSMIVAGCKPAHFACLPLHPLFLCCEVNPLCCLYHCLLAAASPKIGTAPAPPAPTSLGLHTPGRGELPPPPASLVEKFLRDHNFLAVQHEQMEVSRALKRCMGLHYKAGHEQHMHEWGGGVRQRGVLKALPACLPACLDTATRASSSILSSSIACIAPMELLPQEWLEMEQQFGEVQAALAEMQAALAEKDAQIAAYEQDLSSKDHGTVSGLARSVRAWASLELAQAGHAVALAAVESSRNLGTTSRCAIDITY